MFEYHTTTGTAPSPMPGAAPLHTWVNRLGREQHGGGSLRAGIAGPGLHPVLGKEDPTSPTDPAGGRWEGQLPDLGQVAGPVLTGLAGLAGFTGAARGADGIQGAGVGG